MTRKASQHLFSLWYSVDALQLSLQPLLSSLLSLSAREVLGILGIVCSSFLPSLLSHSTLFSRSPLPTLFTYLLSLAGPPLFLAASLLDLLLLSNVFLYIISCSHFF